MGRTVLAETLGCSPPRYVVYSCLPKEISAFPQGCAGALAPSTPISVGIGPLVRAGRGGEVLGEGADS